VYIRNLKKKKSREKLMMMMEVEKLKKAAP
jgi:hypothetical protein